jgi:hypothetical protein
MTRKVPRSYKRQSYIHKNYALSRSCIQRRRFSEHPINYDIRAKRFRGGALHMCCQKYFCPLTKIIAVVQSETPNKVSLGVPPPPPPPSHSSESGNNFAKQYKAGTHLNIFNSNSSTFNRQCKICIARISKNANLLRKE